MLRLSEEKYLRTALRFEYVSADMRDRYLIDRLVRRGLLLHKGLKCYITPMGALVFLNSQLNRILRHLRPVDGSSSPPPSPPQ